MYDVGRVDNALYCVINYKNYENEIAKNTAVLLFQYEP